MAQLSHPYMTTGKTIALTIWTFVGKVMSLLFTMLSRLAIAFLLIFMCVCVYIYLYVYVYYFFRFFSVIGYYKTLNIDPCVMH